jgi:hypothetical protein
MQEPKNKSECECGCGSDPTIVCLELCGKEDMATALKECAAATESMKTASKAKKDAIGTIAKRPRKKNGVASPVSASK